MRALGLDIHRDFIEVAIAAGGEIRSGPRVEMNPETLELFAQSLGADDQVVMEVSGNAWEVARIIRPHVAKMVVVSPSDTGISQARAKADRLDARALAKLLASGALESVWVPDEGTRAMRRRLARRSRLVGIRTKAKNEIHAALMRRLIPKPGFSDLFGKAGRSWLGQLELPTEEKETLESALRQLDFADSEIEAIERIVAAEALQSPEVLRLMTVPGVNVITAATFMAAVGDIRRFQNKRKLVAYLGLDPRVRQSGSTEARGGPISKQGSASGRHALVEASWSAVKSPGPIRAFYERTKARRGAQVAIVASARKLACLFWVLLSRGEDYAYGQPSLHRKKLRRLELMAGAPKERSTEGAVWGTNRAMRKAERALAEQAQAAYERTVSDWKRTQRQRAAAKQKVDASQTSGHAHIES